MALIKEYFNLTTQYQESYGANTILLMQVGSFFEVYAKYDSKTNKLIGSRIYDFSQICELNIVEKNVCVGANKIHMAGFKDIMIEKYLQKIQNAGFTVVVYAQDQAAKNTTRSCAGIFSPGTYFSNNNTNLTNNLMCVWINKISNSMLFKGQYVVVGVSNIDIHTGKTSIFQFKETYLKSPTTYDELERFVSIYNPSEAIFISNLDEKEIHDIVKFVDVNAKSIHVVSTLNNKSDGIMNEVLNCEKQTYQKEILNKFYTITNYESFIDNFYNNDMACQSFCFLLNFAYKHNPNLVNRISVPIFEDCSSRLHLANHSLKQLNIIDDNNYKGKYSSVLTMLNQCHTAMGRREFSYSFTHPTSNVDYLQNEYDITEHFIQRYAEYDTFLDNNLSTIKDLAKYQRQIFLKKITPRTFFHLYDSLETILKIYDKISKDQVIYKYMIQKNNSIGNTQDMCKSIMAKITQVINLDLAKEIEQLQGFETNFINRNVSKELDEQNDLLMFSEQKLEAIRKHLNSIIPDKSKTTTEFVKIHETEKNNFALVCTNRRCKLLESVLPNKPTTVTLQYKNNREEFQYTVSKNHFEYAKQSAANNFICDDTIKQLCKNIGKIKINMKDVILLEYNKFVRCFEDYTNMLDGIIEFVTLVDLLYNKSRLSQQYNFCKPDINTEACKSFIDAKKLRHSLIENIQTSESYTSNDICLGNNAQDGVLLYGTNAVGKTSFIRSIGIAVIMAQSGFYVPASSFHYKPYKHLFTRILGNDNIFKGLSTFAVEMSELRTILKLSNENSLVLGDELCSGTEIMSATSIFVSGIQELHNQKCSYIFATHLHEIINYDEIKEINTLSLKHMEVSYDKEKDMLIYDRKLKDGPGNNMYGLEVCKSLHLPEEFLNRAYEIRMKYNNLDAITNTLSLGKSHFNSRKIMGICEKCNLRKGEEVHHLMHQSFANEKGVINKDGVLLHKNNLANLVTLCKECHDELHKTHTKGSKKKKTTKGYIIEKI